MLFLTLCTLIAFSAPLRETRELLRLPLLPSEKYAQSQRNSAVEESERVAAGLSICTFFFSIYKFTDKKKMITLAITVNDGDENCTCSRP